VDDSVAFIPLAFVAIAIVFWGWMFRDLWANPDLPVSSPGGFIWPPESKNGWTLIFVVLNIFGAAFYYLAIYRTRR